jgi:hypothetical protein
MVAVIVAVAVSVSETTGVSVDVEVVESVTTGVNVEVAEAVITAVGVCVPLAVAVEVELMDGVGVIVRVPYICGVFVAAGAAGDDGEFFLQDTRTKTNAREIRKTKDTASVECFFIKPPFFNFLDHYLDL